MAPPLDINFADVPTDFQLVVDGFYDLRIDEVKVSPTSKGGKMLKFVFSTTTPAKSIRGDQLNPGVKLFHNQNITPSGKATWDMIIKGPSGIAALFQHTGLAGEINMTNMETLGVQRLHGRTIRCSVGMEPAGTTPEGKSFREKNVIKYYTKAS
jgi:hypothetical protein